MTGTAYVIRILPGVGLTAAITAAAFVLRQLPGVNLLSPLILAAIIGMLLHNVIGVPEWAKEGVRFSMKRVLRVGIVLLGLQLTIEQLFAVGLSGILVLAATVVAAFLFTQWLGRLLGVDAKLAQLIAVGTSICGASAIIAANTVTQARDEDVTYSLASITLFGTISILIYPLVGAMLGMDSHAYGLWAGASVHEVAQVVAASFQYGQQAGEFGMISKLSRVMMLAPLVIMLSALKARAMHASGTVEHAKVPLMPWFVTGFLIMMFLNSFQIIPVEITRHAPLVTQCMLALALAAMGLETKISELRARGIKPLMVGAGAWIFIALFSLLLVKVST